MSGHSKWANIKNRKESQDKKRGKIFSKLSRLITIAVKEGKSGDPSVNSRLRMAIDRAREENMPKDNIEKAIESAEKKQEAIEEFVLEGYGPKGIAVLIEAVTDNRQRTIQEVKSIFSRSGGSLAEPGAVAFQFKKRGLVEIDRPSEEKVLKLIDLGANEIEDKGNKLIVWVDPSGLDGFIKELGKSNIVVKRSDLVFKPKMPTKISDSSAVKEILDFLEVLENHEDIQEVSANINIPEELPKEATSNE